MQEIDKSQFVDGISENFECPICLNYLNYQTAVYDKHGHSFCMECIVPILQTNSICPMSMTPISLNELCPCLILRKEIAQSKVWCKYRRVGCDHVGQLEFLRSHEDECKFSNRFCSKCNITVATKKLVDHDCITTLKEENRLLNLKLCNTVSKKGESLLLFGQRHLCYDEDPKLSKKQSVFAINNCGNILFLVFDSNDSDSRCMLFSNGYLQRTHDMTSSKGMHRIAISNEVILYLFASNKQFKLESYDFSFNKLHEHSQDFTHPISHAFNIDCIWDKIFVKLQCKSKDMYYQYIYEFDKKLNEKKIFECKGATKIRDICMLNCYILLHYRIDPKISSFVIKQLSGSKEVANFSLVFELDIRIEIGPENELFILNSHDGKILHYDLLGRLKDFISINCVKKLSKAEFRVNKSYDTVIGSVKEGVLYF